MIQRFIIIKGNRIIYFNLIYNKLQQIYNKFQRKEFHTQNI